MILIQYAHQNAQSQQAIRTSTHNLILNKFIPLNLHNVILFDFRGEFVYVLKFKFVVLNVMRWALLFLSFLEHSPSYLHVFSLVERQFADVWLQQQH